jgi:hypothetical protein
MPGLLRSTEDRSNGFASAAWAGGAGPARPRGTGRAGTAHRRRAADRCRADAADDGPARSRQAYGPGGLAHRWSGPGDPGTASGRQARHSAAAAAGVRADRRAAAGAGGGRASDRGVAWSVPGGSVAAHDAGSGADRGRNASWWVRKSLGRASADGGGVPYPARSPGGRPESGVRSAGRGADGAADGGRLRCGGGSRPRAAGTGAGRPAGGWGAALPGAGAGTGPAHWAGRAGRGHQRGGRGRLPGIDRARGRDGRGAGPRPDA